MNIPHSPVLLVEDDPNDVLLIQRAFRKANLVNPLHVVGDGEEAIAYLSGQGVYAERERHPLPILILLDLKLPRKSGHEVLAWLRRQPELKRLPAVVLTSSREAADVNRVYDLGANSYLVKPVAFDDLLKMAQTLNMYWLILNERPAVAPPKTSPSS
ncbi:MAG: two-component system response regulator [Candidatus Handelsmanbacteria bacterium RIFCSPLOWO2_12_FULL_64_10]|uniref:Two-component system response regulator n=1 Tax=Handelsmanbacteria sp. (strain RIFCSPLOWO2_12_FULL_64_10) TaxID=1817868 RepID=A0A1F6C3U6_HANXR|nr:MAG: two-component system response regulator [Candidatus Handelsmanbacteria bacterium RIFCSPLOWO2_12_FULL_64_10]